MTTLKSTSSPERPPAADESNPRAVNAEGIRLVVQMAKTEPWRMGLALFGGVVWGAMVVGSTMVLGKVQDDVINPVVSGERDRSVVIWAVVALIAVGLLRGGSVVLRRWFGSVTEARVQASTRRSLVSQLLRMRMAERRRWTSGQLLAVADSDVNFSTMALMPVPLAVGLLALIVVSLFSLFQADWTFAVIGAVLFPALYAISRYYSARMVEPAELTQAQVGEVSRVAHESFDGSMVVKVLGRESAEVERFAEQSATLRDVRIRLARVNAEYHPLVDGLPYLGMVALMVVGAFRMRSGAVTQGEVLQAVLLFGWLNFPVRVTGFLFESLPRAVVSYGRVSEAMATPRFEEFAGERRSLPVGPLGLRLDSVSFAYDPGVPVLPGLDLEVKPGEVMAVVGATGVGKSTVCELLVRLEEPDSGSILVGDVPVVHVPVGELAGSVVLGFQESVLFADTLRFNLSLGTEATDDEIWEALDIAQARGFVSELPEGLGTVMGERGVTLSGGQRQRVALARALLRQPRILLLDDATSAVDARTESRILQEISSNIQGITMVIVAHRMSTIRVADRVAFMEDGRIAALGTHTELLVNPAYSALVSAYESEMDPDELLADGPDAGAAANPGGTRSTAATEVVSDSFAATGFAEEAGAQ